MNGPPRQRPTADWEQEAASFNADHRQPDFSYWAGMDYWQLWEAVALSLGIDPQYIKLSKDGEETIVAFAPELSVHKNLVAAVNQRISLVDRAKIPSFGDRQELIEPVPFLEWAKARRLSVPPSLEAAVAEIGGAVRDLRADLDKASSERDELKARLEEVESDSKLEPRVRNSLLTMIAAMATDVYGYKPADKHSSTVRDIQNAVSAAGLELSDDTIRKRLQEAGQLLSKDHSE